MKVDRIARRDGGPMANEHGISEWPFKEGALRVAGWMSDLLADEREKTAKGFLMDVANARGGVL